MKIWELLPIDPTNEPWAASVYSDRVVIRADSDDRARQIANLALRKATGKLVGGRVISPPWEDPELVECGELTNGSFDTEGDEAILEPAEYNLEWQR